MWHNENVILCITETYNVLSITSPLGAEGAATGREDFLITTRGRADPTLHKGTWKIRTLVKMKPQGRRGRLRNRGEEEEVERKGQLLSVFYKEVLDASIQCDGPGEQRTQVRLRKLASKLSVSSQQSTHILCRVESKQRPHGGRLGERPDSQHQPWYLPCTKS